MIVLKKNHKREASAFRVMHRRCEEPGFRDYPRYGGAGIRVCKEWHSFQRFLSDMGPAPCADSWLGRSDVTKGYTPKNTIWTTQPEQERRRQWCKHIEIDGRQLTVAEAARAFGLVEGTLYRRLNAGYPLAKALTRKAFRTGRSPRQAESPETVTN